MNLNANSPGIFAGVYAETTMCLGRFAAGNNPLTIKGSQFSLANINSSWLVPPLVLECAGPVLFDTCYFAASTSVMDAFNFPGSKQLIFDNCTFSGAATTGIMPCIGISRCVTDGCA